MIICNVSFDLAGFRQPIQDVEENVAALLTNLWSNGIPSAPVASTPSNAAVDCLVTDIVNLDEVLSRTADISHLY